MTERRLILMTQQEEQQLHRDRYYIVNDILHIVYYDPILKRRTKTGIEYTHVLPFVSY